MGGARDSEVLSDWQEFVNVTLQQSRISSYGHIVYLVYLLKLPLSKILSIMVHLLDKNKQIPYPKNIF